MNKEKTARDLIKTREALIAVDHIEAALQYAFSEGFPEFGYDPVAVIRNALAYRRKVVLGEEDRSSFEAAWRKKNGIPDSEAFPAFQDGSYSVPSVNDAYTGWKMAHQSNNTSPLAEELYAALEGLGVVEQVIRSRVTNDVDASAVKYIELIRNILMHCPHRRDLTVDESQAFLWLYYNRESMQRGITADIAEVDRMKGQLEIFSVRDVTLPIISALMLSESWKAYGFRCELERQLKLCVES